MASLTYQQHTAQDLSYTIQPTSNKVVLPGTTAHDLSLIDNTYTKQAVKILASKQREYVPTKPGVSVSDKGVLTYLGKSKAGAPVYVKHPPALPTGEKELVKEMLTPEGGVPAKGCPNGYTAVRDGGKSTGFRCVADAAVDAVDGMGVPVFDPSGAAVGGAGGGLPIDEVIDSGATYSPEGAPARRLPFGWSWWQWALVATGVVGGAYVLFR